MTRSPQPSLRYAKANIRKVYAAATPAEIAEGAAWYDQARTLAARLDPDNPARAAGVIAALSPLTPWNRNVTLAELAYAMGELRAGTLRRSAAAASAILAGARPEDVLTGAKVRNFYLSIVGDPDAVCVDRHAFDVAVGRKTDDDTRAMLTRKGVYEKAADAYRAVAAELGIAPSVLQATTWVTWRRMSVTGRYAHLVPNVLTAPSAASAGSAA